MDHGPNRARHLPVRLAGAGDVRPTLFVVYCSEMTPRTSSGWVRFALIAAAAGGLAVSLAPVSANQTAPLKWYKGNLHTHTIHSDGDSTPHEVATWYKDSRYQFLVLSDHNYLTDVSALNALHAAREKFLLIPGEEVTDGFQGKPVHVNGYNVSSEVQPPHGASLAETIQNNVNAIRAAGGLPSVNHPNFKWAIPSKVLMSIENLNLFEVYNGHPTVNNRGGGGYESLEEIWDAMLAGGKRVYGIAVDDAHHFKVTGRQYSNPGRGWVVVRAPQLSASDIMSAVAAGNFYASTGVELSDVSANDSELRISIRTAPDTLYRTRFIGEGGKLLKTASDNPAVYAFQGGEKYVRARVESSNGDDAWVQPFFRSR